MEMEKEKETRLVWLTSDMLVFGANSTLGSEVFFDGRNLEPGDYIEVGYDVNHPSMVCFTRNVLGKEASLIAKVDFGAQFSKVRAAFLAVGQGTILVATFVTKTLLNNNTTIQTSPSSTSSSNFSYLQHHASSPHTHTHTPNSLHLQHSPFHQS
jgi:hypothetical protein